MLFYTKNGLNSHKCHKNNGIKRVLYDIKNLQTVHHPFNIKVFQRFGNFFKLLFYALGGNRTPILRTGISRAIRCTTRALCNLRMLTVRIIIIAKFIWFYKLYFNEEASKSEDLLAKVVILLMSK